MKTYSIISTYPEHGSKNIGDALITHSTINAIKSLKDTEEIKFQIIWRGEKWGNVKHNIINSDLVIFACLAIRPNMDENEYPFIQDFLKCDVPYAVLAAGTSLKITDRGINYNFSDKTLNVLKEMDKHAIFFTTRGVLTQWCCKELGLKNTKMMGDIAFFDSRFDGRTFNSSGRIKKIAISDPHYSERFMDLFNALINTIKNEFSSAEINIIIHGKNENIVRYSKKNNIKYINIYEDIETGLDIYDEYDLHVGFRIHGHVSMLKRRGFSYLLEQDGRGVDYGLTIEKNISVRALSVRKLDLSLKGIVKLLLRSERNYKESNTPVNYADEIVSMIKYDHENHFTKFNDLEKQINRIVNNNKEIISLLL